MLSLGTWHKNTVSSHYIIKATARREILYIPHFERAKWPVNDTPDNLQVIKSRHFHGFRKQNAYCQADETAALTTTQIYKISN